jgi:hypothetical protein
LLTPNLIERDSSALNEIWCARGVGGAAARKTKTDTVGRDQRAAISRPLTGREGRERLYRCCSTAKLSYEDCARGAARLLRAFSVVRRAFTGTDQWLHEIHMKFWG